MKRTFLLAFALLLGIASYAQNSGYEKSVEINGAFGLDDYQKYTFGIGMVNGYRINDNLYLGVGIGYEYLKGMYYKSYEYVGGITGSKKYDSYDIRNNVQLFGRIKANLTSSNVSPFLSVDLGYNVGLGGNEIKMANGLFYEPAFGIDFKLDEKQSIYFMIGYNGQNYEYKFYNLTLGSAGNDTEKKTAGKLSLRLGFVF